MNQLPTRHEPPPQVQMMQMVMGSWVAQLIGAIARFEVSDHIASGLHRVEDLARVCGADTDALHRLLRAGAMVGVVCEIEPGQFGLMPLGETLRSDVPGSMRDAVISGTAPGGWLPWGRICDAVKTGRPTSHAALGNDLWSYYSENPDEAAYFARAMSNISAMAAAEVLASGYDFSQFTHIVDVGGSQGAMLAGILRTAPRSKGVLFDRPEVIEAGRATVMAYGLGDRLTQVAGDFLKEAPQGGDLYVLKWILHDWADADCLIILRNIQRASGPRGRAAIIEMVRPERVVPTPTFLMDLNMLVAFGGRERTEKEFGALLGAAGWKIARVVPTQGLFQIIEAERRV